MKQGDIITIDRSQMGGTGYYYYPVLLTGGAALLGTKNELVRDDSGDMEVGFPEIQYFTFQFLRAGKAEIQLARFRAFDSEDILYEDVMTFEVESLESDFLGAWSLFEELDENDRAVFDKAVSGLTGVSYLPEQVSKQLVNGTNYRFFCYDRPAVLGAHRFPSILKVHVSTDGSVELQDIERVVL